MTARKLMPITVTFLICAGVSASADHALWPPDRAALQKIESEIPTLASLKGHGCSFKNINDYGRYYMPLFSDEGNSQIWGQFRSLKDIHSAKPGIHIGTGPYISDGGCSIINVWIDAKTLALNQASWGGR